MPKRSAQVVVRVLIDFILTHLSMLMAIHSAAIYHTLLGDPAAASSVMATFQQYYLRLFWPLSFLFPATYYMSGIYTYSRSFPTRYKMAVLLRGISLGLLLLLSGNFFVFRSQLVARSVGLFFAVYLVGALVASRLLKPMLFFLLSSQPANCTAAASKERVLVVGGAGYIGSLLVHELLERGRKVRVLDNVVYGDAAIRDVLNDPNLEFIKGDCRSIQSVVSAMRGVSSIIHLAAIVGDPACELDHQTSLEINYTATRMLIEVAKGHGVERFLFASSCSVYGATDELMTESSRVEPISLYGQTKVDSERILLQSGSGSFHPVILRLATVFGNSYRPRFDLVVNLLTAKAQADGVITIYNGEQWRPFVHVRDVVEGFLKALDAPLPLVSGQIFNLGDGNLNHTLCGIGNEIRAAFPGTRIEHVENDDRRTYRVSFDKIRTRLGFRCKWTIEDGIAELKRALESGDIAHYTDLLYHNQRFLEASGTPGSRTGMDAHVMAAFAKALKEEAESDALRPVARWRL